jgi:hypothetical protein
MPKVTISRKRQSSTCLKWLFPENIKHMDTELSSQNRHLISCIVNECGYVGAIQCWLPPIQWTHSIGKMHPPPPKLRTTPSTKSQSTIYYGRQALLIYVNINQKVNKFVFLPMAALSEMAEASTVGLHGHAVCTQLNDRRSLGRCRFYAGALQGFSEFYSSTTESSNTNVLAQPINPFDSWIQTS